MNMKICRALYTSYLLQCRNISNHVITSNFLTRKLCNNKNYFIVQREDVAAKVIIIPYYQDNYSYIFHRNSEEGVVVDPADYITVNKIASIENIKIKYVLCTHKHIDHNNGNKHYFEKQIHVYGIKENDNPYINQNLANVDSFQISQFYIKTLVSNFHSKNQVSYLVQDTKNKKLKNLFFSGDFLFLSGLGRNFERNNEDMYNSVNYLHSLDKTNTLIFCGHEYTLSNIKFALSVETNNEELKNYYKKIQNIRIKQLPSVPALLMDEYEHNPFLRCDKKSVQESIKAYAKKHKLNIVEPKDYLIILRRMKDEFRDT